MNRRSILGLLSLPVLLAACGDSQSVTRRFRVIATFEVDGRNVEASTVMQLTVSRVLHSLIGQGASYSLVGEAIIMDLPGRGTVFILPSTEKKLYRDYYVNVYSVAGISKGLGGWEDADFDRLRTVDGRFPFGKDAPPAIVAFTDDAIPRTIYEVDPNNVAQSFPGVRFKGIEIEFTEAPVTKALVKRLPWLAHPSDDVFPDNRDVLKYPYLEGPIGVRIRVFHFFGTGL
jgi:hypothetical protein